MTEKEKTMPIEKLRPSFTFTEDRLKELQAVVPEAFADGKINWDVLREALGEYLEEPDQEHFGLTWPGKRSSKKLAYQLSNCSLIPHDELSKNLENTRNVFIEGDNLEVLKLLKKSYANRIGLIYIDPPYNTGNDFIYDDSYNDSWGGYLQQMGLVGDSGQILTTNRNASGRFHSNWLSMIYPRLVLARNLLSDEGTIVVHIDENELATLLLVMREVFGEENELGIIIWDKLNPKGDASGIAYQHEVILVFAKNKEILTAKRALQRPKKNASAILKKASDLFGLLGKNELPPDVKDFLKKYKLPEERFSNLKRTLTLEIINQMFSDWIREQDFSGGEAAYSKIDENGEVFRLVSMAWPNKKRAPDDYFIPIIHPITGKECPIPTRGWRYPSRTIQELLNANQIIFGKDETTQPQRKYLLKDNMFENIPSVIRFGGSDDQLFRKMGIAFDNPKPLAIARQVVAAFSGKDDIVLDFFAGSGTTAQAVLEVNQSDQGTRRYICIQLPERIDESHEAYKLGFRKVSDIFIHRLNYVYDNYNSKDVSIDYGYRYFSLSASNFRGWSDYLGKDVQEVETLFSRFETPLVDGWKKENLLCEILLISGLGLDTKLNPVDNLSDNQILQVTNQQDGNSFLICLDEKIHQNSLEWLVKAGELTFICLDSAITDEQKIKLKDSCSLRVI